MNAFSGSVDTTQSASAHATLNAYDLGTLLREIERPTFNWREEAVCDGANPDLFYPELGEQAGEAKRVCACCPVRFPCLAAGLFEPFGVWGGTAEFDRRPLRRKLSKLGMLPAKPVAVVVRGVVL